MCSCAVLLTLLCFVSAMRAVSAYADEYEIIIEKNLFHDQRQKWEMERPEAAGDSASGPGAQEQRDIAQINLFGTVIDDSQAYAVMRLTAPAAQRGGLAHLRSGPVHGVLRSVLVYSAPEPPGPHRQAPRARTVSAPMLLEILSADFRSLRSGLQACCCRTCMIINAMKFF